MIKSDQYRFQYFFEVALQALDQSEPVVLLIMDTMREMHESMKLVYQIAESLQDR